MTHLFAELGSTEAVLMTGMGVMGGVVTMLWRKTEKENARQVLRADKSEAENKACQTLHAEAETKRAVLANDVGHLRDRVTFFERHFSILLPPVAASAIQELSSQPSETPTQPIQ